MTVVLVWFLVCCVTLCAAVLGGVLGFGTAAVLLPVLSLVLGVRTAVPVLGIAMIFSNASRAAFSWREIDWKIVLAFSSVAVPMTLLGANFFNGAAGPTSNAIVALFLLALVPMRRIGNRLNLKIRWSHFPWLGGAIGLITGLGGAVGPASAPFYLSYGLVKAAYIGTDGLNSTLMYGVRSATYWTGGAMKPSSVFLGLMLGPLMIAGSFIGKLLVDRLDPQSFTKYIEAFLLVLGAYLLVRSLLR